MQLSILPGLLALSALLAPAPLDGNESRELERALDAIHAGRICADVEFIASDELQGRDSPSQGLRLAARYIRSRLQSLGLEPAGDDGYFDRYSLERKALAEDGARAWVEKGSGVATLEFGADYFFWPNGVADSDVVGKVVFAGRGTREEVEGIELAGRWALVEESEDLGWRERMDNVRERGAIGMLGIQSAESGGARMAERVARYTSRGSLSVQSESESEEEFFPQLTLTREAAMKLSYTAGSEPGTPLGVTFRDQRISSSSSAPVELENVCGLWPGSDPELKHDVIVISAHYDHVGVTDGEIYNGADDNGSGTCGMLAIAEALASYGPMRRSVLLLWVSAEEKGLLGSRAWTMEPTLPEGYRAVCNLNIDMIGRNAPDYLLITPTRERPEYNGLVRLAEANAPHEGFPTLGGCDDYWRRSDHMNFAENLGLPVAFLFSDVHEDYHQPSDTSDKIDCDKIRRVSRLVVRMIEGLQGDELEL